MKQFFSLSLILLLGGGAFVTETKAQSALKFLEVLQQKQKQAEQSATVTNAEEDSIPQLTSPNSESAEAPAPSPADDPFDIDPAPQKPESIDNLEELPLPTPTGPKATETNRPEATESSAEQRPAANATVSPAPRAFLGAKVEQAGGAQLGVKVKKVIADSPAEAAGIRVGDRLITVAGSPVTNEKDLQDLLGVLAPGDRIEVELMRDRRKSKIAATLAAGVGAGGSENDLSAANGDALRNVDPKDVAPQSDPRGTFDVVPIPGDERFDPRLGTQQPAAPKLGLQVIDVSEETGIGLRKRVRTGAGVQSVAANSPAAAAGVPVGALIVGANGRRIDKAADLSGYIATLKPGQNVELTYYDGNRLRRSKVELAGADVRQAANFQPVPGDKPGDGESARPVLKELGKQFPALKRVDTLLEKISPNADAPPQLGEAENEKSAVADDASDSLREKLRIQQDRYRPLAERLEKRKPLIPRPR